MWFWVLMIVVIVAWAAYSLGYSNGYITGYTKGLFDGREIEQRSTRKSD